MFLVEDFRVGLIDFYLNNVLYIFGKLLGGRERRLLSDIYKKGRKKGEVLKNEYI